MGRLPPPHTSGCARPRWRLCRLLRVPPARRLARWHAAGAPAASGRAPSRRPRRPRPPPTRSARSRLRSTPRGRPPRAAPPRRLTLADAVWKRPRRADVLRDRAACAIAAGGSRRSATPASTARASSRSSPCARRCKERLTEATARGPTARAGFKPIFAAADEDDPRESTAPRGLPKSRRRRAAAHCWLEIDGRVLDAAADGMALCDAARRLGVDYSDPERMAERLGTEALRAGGVRAPRRARRSSCWASRCPSGEPERGRSRRSSPRRRRSASRARGRRRRSSTRTGRRSRTTEGSLGGERGRPRGGNAAGGGGGVPARRGGRHRDGQGREGARGEAQRRRSLAEEDEERWRVGN